MGSLKEYRDFVMGDELAIINILKDWNCNKTLIDKIVERVHYMQSHACLYGQEMANKGVKTIKQKEEYFELIDKCEYIKAERDHLLIEIKKQRKENAKLQRKLEKSVKKKTQKGGNEND